MLTDFEWKAIINGIEQQQCIICVGSEIYTRHLPENNRSKNLTERLSEYLNLHKNELNIKVQENAWFHLNPGGSDGPAYQAIKSFYNETEDQTSKSILEKIARIKFHLLLSLTPDYHLRQAFENQDIPYQFDSYVRNQPDKSLGKPDKDQPLVYNILGELDNRNSLVLTYDDFYDYLESVIKGNSMSQLIKDNMLDAQYFLFIGMPFDQWFVHLFMRVIKQHKERKTKFATIGQISPNSIDICKEQYHIKFINSEIEAFIDELYERCENHTIPLIKTITPKEEIANPEEVISINKAIIDSLYKWIGKNEFDKISKKLKEVLKGLGETAKPLLLKVIHLYGRHNDLKEKITLGIISRDNENIEFNKIRLGFTTLIAEFEEKVLTQ